MANENEESFWSSPWTYILGLGAVALAWAGGLFDKIGDWLNTPVAAEPAPAATKPAEVGVVKSDEGNKTKEELDAEAAKAKEEADKKADTDNKLPQSVPEKTTISKIYSLAKEKTFAQFLVNVDGAIVDKAQAGAMLVSGYNDGNNFVITKSAIAGDDGNFLSKDGNIQFIKLNSNVKLKSTDGSINLDDNNTKKAISEIREFVTNEQKSLMAKAGGAVGGLAVSAFNSAGNGIGYLFSSAQNKTSEMFEKYKVPTDLGDFAKHEYDKAKANLSVVSDKISKNLTYPKVQVLEAIDSNEGNEQLVKMQLERIDGKGVVRKYQISGTIDNSQANKFLYMDNITEITDPASAKSLPMDGIKPLFIQYSAGGETIAVGDTLKLDPKTTISKIIGEISSKEDAKLQVDKAIAGECAIEIDGALPLKTANGTDCPVRQ